MQQPTSLRNNLRHYATTYVTMTFLANFTAKGHNQTIILVLQYGVYM
jgi:hypothetical protein